MTICATRESQLCRIPKTLMDVVIRQNPNVLLGALLNTTLLHRNHHQGQQSQSQSSSHSGSSTSGGCTSANDGASRGALAVAILPITGSVPIQLFSKRLHEALGKICSVTLLTSELIDQTFGTWLGCGRSYIVFYIFIRMI